MVAGQAAFDLHTTYVEMRGDGRSTAIENTASFWPDVMSGKLQIDGRLVIGFRISEDMRHWEMHPAGEELICLTAGAIDVVLDEAGEEQTIRLASGQVCLIPPDVWHRFVVHETAEVIAVTAGEGTQHRPREGKAD